MFFDLLNIKPPEWHQAFIDGRRLTSMSYNFSLDLIFERGRASVSQTANSLGFVEDTGGPFTTTRYPQTNRPIYCIVDFGIFLGRSDGCAFYKLLVVSDTLPYAVVGFDLYAGRDHPRRNLSY